MPEKSIILYGGGSSLIVEYEEVCRQNNTRIAAIVNNLKGMPCHALSNALQIKPDALSAINSSKFICPLFTPVNRHKATQEAIFYGLTPWPVLIAKSCLLPLHFVVGDGSFINRGVIIGAATQLGSHVLINRGAALGHHLQTGNFVSVGPGVICGGHVTIAEGALVGTGSVILPKIRIGKHSIIGAGSMVTKNVNDYAVVMGNPARKIRENDNFFND